jgi:hypothetical protein
MDLSPRFEEMCMAILPRNHDTRGKSGEDIESDSSGMPRWVKVFAALAVIFVLGFVVLHLSGHGPSNHMPGMQMP